MCDLNQKENATMLEKECDINIARTIELARQMIALAQTGYEQREDDNCGILYGVLLDTGYKLLDMAKKEKHSHVKKGWWNTKEINKNNIDKKFKKEKS